jgi:hypothetical protein
MGALQMTELNFNTESKTVLAIYDQYQKAGEAEHDRGYLGASIIGHTCERYLWYNFRFCCKSEFNGRMRRLFKTGHLEEPRMVSDLLAIGCEVHEVDPSTGEQFEINALGGHFSGHMDGCVLGLPESPKTWHVCEFKTHSNKSFTKLKKEGVKKAKPQHYAQMMVYMGLSGMTRAFYLAKNKDTDELYSERIHFNKEEFDSLMQRAERIVCASTPPEKIATRSDWYECSYCDARKICWPDSDSVSLPVPSINCRQCCYSTPTMDGNAHWKCEKHNRGLSIDDQKKACENHLCLPGLFGLAEPESCDNDSITLINRLGDKWKHGKNGFSTKELMKVKVSQLGSLVIEKAKEKFGAVVKASSTAGILDRLNEATIIFEGNTTELSSWWKDKYKEDIRSLNPVNEVEELDCGICEFQYARFVVLYHINVKKTNSCEVREGIPF